MRVSSWVVRKAGEPMVFEERDEDPGPGEVLVETIGCGVCHTDLSFYYEGVPTRHPFPLTLGHEISGRVVDSGDGAEGWIGKDVIVSAVIPCGDCEACRDGQGAVCPKQIFPGSDVHGGFGTHLKVPAAGLCEVPDLGDRRSNPQGLKLVTLAAIADAVTTPYQAIVRSGLAEGDLAVFVGVGGVGGFGVQIAASLGARVVAIDVDDERLKIVGDHGAALTMNSRDQEFRALRGRLREYARDEKIPSWKTKIFETSGTISGQSTAFGLLGPGGYLSVVGYTAEKLEVRFSNLMALHATAQGNWGCLPEHYPKVLELVLSGKVMLEPFVEHRPLSTINETFAELHDGKHSRRVILSQEA